MQNENKEEKGKTFENNQPAIKWEWEWEKRYCLFKFAI